MPLQRNLTLLYERLRNPTTNLCPSLLPAPKSLRLRQTQPKRNNQHRRTSSKPIQRPPPMRRSIDQRPGKSRSQKIPKRISLLQQTGDNTAGLRRTILQRSGSRITVQPTHRNAEERATRQELLVGLTEARAQLEDHKEQLVDDERPLAAPAVRRDTEDDCADGAQHQHERDAPGNVRDGLVELRGELGGGERDGEKVEGVPCPANEGDLEERLALAMGFTHIQ